MTIRRLHPGVRMSQGVVHDHVLYSAGHVDGDGKTVAEQTRNILARLDALMAEAGTNRSNLLSASIWLTDIGTWHEMNGVWDAWIDPQNPPARATVEARLAGDEHLIEIAIVAAIPREGER